MKKNVLLGGMLIFGSLLLSFVDAKYSIVHMIKCIALAYGITYISYTLVHHRHKRSNAVLYSIGVLVLTLYTIITVDTYVFHTLSFFPGILRYALFSSYGWCYFIFVGMGVCLSFKKTERC